MSVITNQPDTKSNANPNPNPNLNPSTKQHAIVNIQLNIVACPMFY